MHPKIKKPRNTPLKGQVLLVSLSLFAAVATAAIRSSNAKYRWEIDLRRHDSSAFNGTAADDDAVSTHYGLYFRANFWAI